MGVTLRFQIFRYVTFSSACHASLNHITTATLDVKPQLKWEPKKWPKVAVDHDLVLIGWGPDMPCIPNDKWSDKKRGALTLAHWQNLVSRIPKSWYNNPYYNVSADELPFKFVGLQEFLEDHPGMSILLIVSGLRPLPSLQNMRAGIHVWSITSATSSISLTRTSCNSQELPRRSHS